MRRLAFFCLLGAFAAMPLPAPADGLLEQVPDSSDTATYLFPNWRLAPVARFNLVECVDSVCGPDSADCPIVALTLLNYGTADGVDDITGLYINLVCGKTNEWATMIYDKVWTIEGRNYPAWTWSGVLPWAEDPEKGCASQPVLQVYSDIGSCPADGETVTIGLGYNETSAVPGGLLDNCGTYNNYVPIEDQVRTGKEKYIRYVVKVPDKAYVAPADTLRYTIYYGRPGGPSISSFVITDTLPPYTHYLTGTATVPPDLDWNPDPGPPPRLRWTLPGVLATAGGQTQELSYSVSVDWGNMEWFEPGSGDEAAPEGIRLDNRAAVEALDSGCAAARVNPPTETVVRRYIIWKVASQDLLFAPRIGYSDDEIIYSIYLRNQSSKKTWWNIRAWDTVPPELTTWKTGLGFDDPFVGWTMTPTPSAIGSPGRIESVPGTTLLTWTFDLPPDGTLEIRWKASAGTPDSLPGETAITKVSVMEQGLPATSNGTGHSKYPRCFTHVAPLALRTTYFSYVAQATNAGGMGLKINFYPLNIASTFDMRKLVLWGDALGFEGAGGVSPSIVDFQGTCFGFIDGGYGGCGVERAPAQYEWMDSSEETPNAVLYKLTSNVPILWFMMPNHVPGDAFTYLPSTSLNASGFCHYSYRRHNGGETEPGWGESWVVFNTNIDAEGNFIPDMGTSAHVFRWDPINLSWGYIKSCDIGSNALWMPFAGCTPADENHYRIISSDARLVVYQGFGTFGDPKVTFAYNEHGGLVPNAENGLNTSRPGMPGTFYAVAHHDNEPLNLLVGNNGAQKATYRVFHYRPRNPEMARTGIPTTLAGSSGTWEFYGLRTVDNGLNGDNPHVFGNATGYDPLTAGVGTTANAWKIEWVSGGNLSVNTGIAMFREWAGGAPLHPSNGEPTGKEFWYHMGMTGDTWGVMLFCPSTGMKINASSGDGYNSTYATGGPDQCIFFKALTDPGYGGRRAYLFQLDSSPGSTQGEMMGLYHQAQYREKFFVAPFVTTGVHYDVIAPPVVYAGQDFWITVAVILGVGGTKIDYAGVTSFTSTDPAATVQTVPMDAYDYSWVLTDEGVKLFTLVKMDEVGYQSIVVNDTVDGSITGLTTLLVVGTDVKFRKEPYSSVAASGDVVQFKICWSNFSSGSAAEFVITDAIPNSMSYVQEDAIFNFCDDGTYGRPSGTVAFSTTDNDHYSFTDMPATGTSSTVTWLRWTVPMIGIRTSGCACFKARVY